MARPLRISQSTLARDGRRGPRRRGLQISGTVLHGRVTELGGDESAVDTGLRKLTVDVDEMAYNPLGYEGYQEIQKGDRVRVHGRTEAGFFETHELTASSVIELSS